MKNLFYGFGDRNFEILELGSLEGKSTCWFLENIPSCKIVCVDTWEGGVDHDKNNHEINFENIKNNFDHNVSQFGDRVEVMQMTTYDAMIQLYLQNRKFDMVYVDASHTAIDVNCDLVMSWKLLKNNALIYCDDYYWGFNQIDLNRVPNLNSVYDSPKLGIDSFVNTYRNRLNPVIGLQNNAAVFVKVY